MNIKTKEISKAVRENINRNKFTYYSNAVFLQLALTVVGGFLLRFMFQLILISAGQENLTKDNFLDIFTEPLSFLLIIIFILLVSGLVFFEFSALTLMVYFSYKKISFSWKRNFANVFQRLKTLNPVQLLLFMLYFILMIPLSNLGLNSVFSEKLDIPDFITEELVKSVSGTVILVVFAAACAYANLRLIFSIPLTVINGNKFSYNMKKSLELTRKGKIKLVYLFGKFAVVLIFIGLVFLGLSAFVFDIIDESGSIPMYNSVFYTISRIILFFFLMLAKLAMISILVKIIIDHRELTEDDGQYNNIKVKKRKLSAVLISIALIIALGHSGYQMFSESINKDVTVVAHRGYVSAGVENSIEALEGAAKAGADYVELDILLTKDNKFVVMHDYNLKRLAGIDKKVQDMNFNEVVGLEIKQGNFTSHIPSFEEFVARAKELNMKLLVELKPHGKEPENYAELFIDEIRRLGVDKEYKTMSLDLDLMEEIEDKAPEIETGYVIPLQFGSFAEDSIDFFVIEDFSFNDILSIQAKKDGKDIFVWTINDPDKITKYLHKPVSAIITDYPEMVEDEIKNEEEDNSYFEKLYRLLDIKF